MEFSAFFVSMLDDPAWIISSLIVGAAVIGLLAFLWLFRVTRLVITKRIPCPEEKRQATVEFVARVGESGPYRDVRSCSLQACGITCRKACLTSRLAIEAPFLAIAKEAA